MRNNKVLAGILTGFMFVAVMLMTMTSCKSDSKSETEDSGKGESVNYIPAGATAVSRMNLKNMLENSGCKVVNGKITLSADLQEALSDIDKDDLAAGLKLAEGVNLESVYVFIYKNCGYIVFEQTSPEVAAMLAVAMDDATVADGFTVGEVEDFEVMYDSKVVIVTDREKNLTKLRELYNAKDWESIATAQPNVVKYLDNKQDVASVTAMSWLLPINPFESDWLCSSGNFDKNSYVGEVVGLTADGKYEDFSEYFPVIEKEFYGELKDLRQPDCLSMSFALGNPMKIKMLSNLISSSAGSQLGNLKSLVTDIDGAVGLSYSISMTDLANQNFYNVDVCAVANYGATAAQNQAMLQQLASQSPLGNLVNITTSGNYVVATMGDTANAPTLSSNYAGSSAIFTMNLPANEVCRSLGMDFGVDMNCWLEGKAIKANVTLTDTDMPFMATIVKYLLNVKQRYDAYDYSYYDDYEEDDYYDYDDYPELEPYYE